MSLYVRVFTSFYTHRKTMRLRALIGDSAFWVPPRIWSYAASQQQDGCFKDYSASEIALLTGYSGDASSLLQALLQAGFMDGDPLRIHDWEDHNGYHQVFYERARKAALARHSKAKKEKTVQDSTVQEASSASSLLQADRDSDSEGNARRLHGIPNTVEEVIAFGKTIHPPIPEDVCRAFWAHYEGQSRTSPSGEVFWVTSGDAVVTKWKVKLPSFRGSSLTGGNGASTPLWRQRQAIESQIETHPANREFRGYDAETVTPAMCEELKALRKKLHAIEAEEAKGMA